jgi:Ca-activated chloride channel family protein
VVADMSPVLIVLLVVIGLIAIAYVFGLGPDTKGRRPAPGLLKRRSKWRRVLPFIPLVAAVGCLALAFWGSRFNVEERTPAILLVMDVSDSMEETDVEPNRLAAAEAAAIAFLDELPPEFRVGLATFAGEAELPVEPTQDRGRVIEALGDLTTERGTVIGDGLTEALDAIEEVRSEGAETPAAALLLSDGRDTGSRVLPGDAAARARALSVPVFTVVVGQVSGDDGSGADLQAMQSIAETSGGDTFTAQTSDELTRVYEDLGSELSVDLELRSSATLLVTAAIVLTVLAGLLFVLLPR